MLIIGVTGGIGAGKSSVSAILEELGAIVIDADLISKQVVEPDKPAWGKIIEVFGDKIIKKDKTIDGEKLAGIIFNSEEKKLILESIIHKEVIKQIQDKLETMREMGYNGVVALDVPIPVKKGFLDTVNRVWVVVSNDEIRINRLVKRSNMSREDADARILSQLTQEEYIQLGNEVIENDGSEEELEEKVKALYNKFLADFEATDS